MEEGFLGDEGRGSRELVTWVEGKLELGIFLHPKNLGNRIRLPVNALRCTKCGYLELYAPIK